MFCFFAFLSLLKETSSKFGAFFIIFHTSKKSFLIVEYLCIRAIIPDLIEASRMATRPIFYDSLVVLGCLLQKA